MESARLILDLTGFFVGTVKRIIKAVGRFGKEYDAASLERGGSNEARDSNIFRHARARDGRFADLCVGPCGEHEEKSRKLSAARSFAASTAFGTSIRRANRSNRPSTPMRPPIMLKALPRMRILLLMPHSMARNGS